MKNLNFSQLKAYAAESKIVVTGGKRKKETWLKALVENSIPTATACESPALNPTIADYRFQLDTLRQQEDKLFQRALANPQAEMLGQFEAIWNARNIVYTKMENVMTPIPTEPIQPIEVFESIYCTIEEIQAIPKLDWYQMELWGKKEWQSESQTYLCKKGAKLPENIIQQYKLDAVQVAILQQEITLESLKEEFDNEIESVPGRYHDYDDYSGSARHSEGYAYISRDIIMGRY